MSAWDDITKAVKTVAGNAVKGAENVGKDAINLPSQFIQGAGNVGSALNLDTRLGLNDTNHGSSSPVSTSGTTTQNILNQLSTLNYGQETGAGASSLAAQLAKELQSLPAADVEQIMNSQQWKNIAGTGDTTLTQDIGTDLNPTAPASGSGFNDFSIPTMFSSTLAPWLAQQQKLDDTQSAGLAQQIQGALKGATPSVQQGLAALLPGMQQTTKNLEQGANEALAYGPSLDNLNTNLANIAANFKTSASNYANEPYIAATVQGTTPPAVTSGQATVNSIMQGILNGAGSAGGTSG